MLNETEEFNAYTSIVNYCATGKYDSTCFLQVKYVANINIKV